MKKKVGFLGGSFDPLHFGHLNMAIELLEAHQLDSVLFCPAQTSPFKTKSPPIASPKHRMAMVMQGIRNVKEFSALEWEMAQSDASYTVDTVKKLKKELVADLFLLLGEDQLEDLHRWKDVEELFSLCRPLIASRENKSPPSFHHLSSSVQLLIAKGRTAISMMDISSTAIRERLKHKRFCGHLMPEPILEYIKHYQLYS